MRRHLLLLLSLVTAVPLAGCSAEHVRWYENLGDLVTPRTIEQTRQQGLTQETVRAKVGAPDETITLANLPDYLDDTPGDYLWGRNFRDDLMWQLHSKIILTTKRDSWRPGLKAPPEWWKSPPYDGWRVWLYDESRHFWVPYDGPFHEYTCCLVVFSRDQYVTTLSIDHPSMIPSGSTWFERKPPTP